MRETVKTADLRQRLGVLLDRVDERRDQFVIERRGKPLAALVPFAQYEQMQRAAELELIGALDRRARSLTRQQAVQLARRAKRAVR
ncbi:MAG TPA: type II toxin-antitoxin system Phd/YefM family antitoxin [Thermoanaerobaculia bacterium]|nr:type II toxin-antitoxin system Phd/YefM family antitoxin [Thermoanaerobaculia bacterium]